MTCTHDGFHSGQGRYDHASGTLRYVMVCDACLAEVAQIQVEEYRPAFVPRAGAADATRGGAAARTDADDAAA
jgi:hypothetical protein